MSKKSIKKEGTGKFRAAARLINPLSPLYSMTRTVGSGLRTIKDMQEAMARQRKNPRVRTFRQAMAKRPANAVPLADIKRSCTTNRRIALAFGFLSLVYSCASTVPGNWFGVLTGALFTILCAMIATRFAHRSWQIEKGQANPDEKLGTLFEFLRTPGVTWTILNPKLFD